jgi:nucleoside phosphorylase
VPSVAAVQDHSGARGRCGQVIRTAIVAAMAGELKPLVHGPARGWRHQRRNHVDLWRRQAGEVEWVAACAGVGQRAAERALAEIEKDGPVAQIISVGWAGALKDWYKPGEAYRVDGVVDLATNTRLRVAPFSPLRPKDGAGMGQQGVSSPQGLKPTHSPAGSIGTAKAVPFQNRSDSKAEGMGQPVSSVPSLRREDGAGMGHPGSSGFAVSQVPKGKGPGAPLISPIEAAGSTKDVARVGQQDIWLATATKVLTGAKEKADVAISYYADLVDMEAMALARVARGRGVAFHCIKGVSDGVDAVLPDFNPFLAADGRFKRAKFIVFALLHPGYWQALKQMGENSKRSAQRMAELVLEQLDPEGTIRRQNGDANFSG